MNIDSLLSRVSQVDLAGILKVTKEKLRQDGGECVRVEFWRIRGAFKDDKEETVSMVIDPDGPDGDLYFLAPSLEDCEPKEMALTIYMDANRRTIYGAHRWNAGKGEVSFSYSLPLPPNSDDFPDVALLQRLLKEMYEGLLFREVKEWEMRISRDDMLSEEEKSNKADRLIKVFKTLSSPKETDDGAV